MPSGPTPNEAQFAILRGVHSEDSGEMMPRFDCC